MDQGLMFSKQQHCHLLTVLPGGTIYQYIVSTDPCRLQGCKNRPAPFSGRMSCKATKPGSVCPLSWPRYFEYVYCAVNWGHFLLCYLCVLSLGCSC